MATNPARGARDLPSDASAARTNPGRAQISAIAGHGELGGRERCSAPAGLRPPEPFEDH